MIFTHETFQLSVTIVFNADTLQVESVTFFYISYQAFFKKLVEISMTKIGYITEM